MNLFQTLGEYVEIAVGLLFGTLAHFGRLYADSQPITTRSVIGFLMQLGLLALLAAVVTREMGMTGEVRALTTGAMALSAQEVVQWLKRVGWRRVLNVPESDKESGL